MTSPDYITVARIRNDTSREMRLYLECIGDEVVLSSGHEVELLGHRSDGLLPLTFNYMNDGLQCYAHLDPDPDWHIKFKGRLYCAGRPTATRIADLEADASSEAAEGSS